MTGVARPHGRAAEDIALARLLGDVYDCALDPSVWPRALGSISAYVRSAASSVEWRDRQSGSSVIYEHGGDQKFLRRLADEASESKLDRQSSAAALRSRHLSAIDKVGLREEYRPGRSLMRPGAGYRDLIAVQLLEEGTAQARISIARSVIQRQYSVSDRRAIESIAPHIARTLAISHALELKKLEASRLDTVLDRLPTPIALTDGQGHPLFLNTSAARLVGTGSVLGVTEGRLHAQRARAQENWARAFSNPSSPDERPPLCASILLGSNSTAAIAHVLDLQSRDGIVALAAARKAVFVVSPDQTFVTLPAAFAALHGLSTAEVRLLVKLAEGGGLEGVAHQLGISVSTARTHLHRIFSKTDTTRQPELIRRFLSHRCLLGDPAAHDHDD